MKVSLILPSFRRATLLDLGLSSIAKYTYDFPLEIVVVNDGLEDETRDVCRRYADRFEMKYLFSGQRNVDGIKMRIPGYAINIGVRNCTGDIIVLSCPEVYHVNNCLKLLIFAAQGQPQYLVIPESMYFDDVGTVTNYLLKGKTEPLEAMDAIESLTSGIVGTDAVTMPYLMAMYKEKFMEIGGYDEDFTGYAGDDNDLVHRLLFNNSMLYGKLPAKIIHMYHGVRCDAQMHPENPRWVYNYELFLKRKNQRVRNQGIDWGRI